MLARKLMGGAGAEETLYVDDVFSTYLYTGNGSTQTITNGIDLAGEGGLVWVKDSTNEVSHALFDTVQGRKVLYSNTTNAATSLTEGKDLLTYDSTGFTLGVSNSSFTNQSTKTYVSWTFRKAPKFFDVQTATLSSGNATVSFSNLSTLGMVIVKRTDSTGDWYVWHRSLTAGKLVYLNQTAAEATLGHITVSGTTLTLVDGTLADGNYVCYAFAHDTEEDGIIQCGSFTTDGSGNATVNLGWEPQYVMIKGIGGTYYADSWYMVDNMRGFSVTGGARLSPNDTTAEATFTDLWKPTSTGFIVKHNPSTTYIYLAIRRPNKPPTSGTEVYNAIARTATGAAGSVTGVGFVPDLLVSSHRSGTYGNSWYQRITAEYFMKSNANWAVSGGNVNFGAIMDGYYLTNGDGSTNFTGTYIHNVFRRAPGFFDVVCDTGTGSAHTVSHNLGVVPELMIRKKRSAADNWIVYAGDATDYLILNTTAATTDLDTMWNDTAPTASVFTVGTNDDVNQSTGTFVTYLFATLAGISKVGSYTGNGSSQTINCGFSAGARFILIKRTDSTGDWYIWDSVRGIVAANDPHLSLNTTAAEVTTDDSVDPDNSGFIVNQNTTTNINVTSATYIYLAVA